MCPVLILKEGVVVENYTLDLLDPSKRDLHRTAGYSYYSGWSACNLTSINVSTVQTEDEFLKRVEVATLLGTIQAAYTDVGYLDRDSEIPVNKLIIEREALLGISMCGVLDNPKICLSPSTLQAGAKLALLKNEIFAKKINIKPASRLTCIKPEGTNSLALGGIASGIHPRRSRRYIRRIQASSLESVFQTFRQVNPTCVEKMVGPGLDDDSYCVCFPMESPQDAIVQTTLDPIEHLKSVQVVQENWVSVATRPERLEAGLHSVSVTVTVSESEWAPVQEFVWQNRHSFVGLSFLPSFGDYVFDYAPQQAVYEAVEGVAYSEKEAAAWVFWNRIKSEIKDVDYSAFIETEDGTTLAENLACGVGGCDLI